jgi:hypothetical protein
MVQGGKILKKQIQPVGWQVSHEDVASWLALMSITKAFKFLRKNSPDSIK